METMDLRPFALALAALTLTACTGELGAEPRDPEGGAEDMSAADLSSPEDASMTPRDMGGEPEADMADMQPPPAEDMAAPRDEGTTDPCEGVTCGDNASCEAGACQCDPGFEGDPTAGCAPPDPCEGVTCGDNAECREGACVCPPGFLGDPATRCAPDSPGDIALRTEQDVCTRWNQDYANQSTMKWAREPVDDCDPGELHPDFLDDALRRINLYRWLVGLEPVVLKEPYLTQTQHCATTMAAEGVFTHSLTPDMRCYTQEAGAGARSSNIAAGVRDAASSVDLYIFDRGVTSLGHRRWTFNPAMGATGFGHRGSYSCMSSFDSSNSSARADYVAYPAPGFFPNRALGGSWSFASNAYRISSSSTVSIKRLSDMAEVPVSNVYVPGGSYGRMTTLAWSPDSGMIQTGEEYEVTIGGLQKDGVDTSVTYRTTLTACR